MFNESGFPKVYATDSSGGETNGQYAAVTENEVAPNDGTYLDENSPDVFGDASDWIQTIIGGVKDVSTAISQQKIAQAQTQAQIARIQSPTLSQQWAKLTAFEQMSIVLGVAGFVYLIARR